MASTQLKLLKTVYLPGQWPIPQGLEIVMVGRSNVGKSTLINRLAGRANTEQDQARVSQRPGCTQSVNFFALWPGYVLVDLPGYGYAQLSKEKRENLMKLVEDYFQAKRPIGTIVHIIDARLPAQPVDLQLQEWIQEFNYPYLLTLNKCDKVSRSILNRQKMMMEKFLATYQGPHRSAMISAKTGEGIPNLKHMIQELAQLRGSELKGE